MNIIGDYVQYFHIAGFNFKTVKVSVFCDSLSFLSLIKFNNLVYSLGFGTQGYVSIYNFCLRLVHNSKITDIKEYEIINSKPLNVKKNSCITVNIYLYINF